MSLDELIEHFKNESVLHADKETRYIAYDTVEYLKELKELKTLKRLKKPQEINVNIYISKSIIIKAISLNYNISEEAVDLNNYAQKQILESLEYYVKYWGGRLI